MNDYPNTTKTSLLKNVIGRAIYEVNGRRMTFKIVYYDSGVPYGYCKTKGWWAHLYPQFIEEDKRGMIPAIQISLK